MYINKAYVYGNLTRDPELRSLPNGTKVASFSLATNRVYKKADGSRAEETEFHSIAVFGKTAEAVGQHLCKGSSAYVEGRLQTRTWENHGHNQSKTEIIADNVQFGPKGSRTVASTSSAIQDELATKRAPEGQTEASGVVLEPEEGPNPDDIPF